MEGAPQRSPQNTGGMSPKDSFVSIVRKFGSSSKRQFGRRFPASQPHTDPTISLSIPTSGFRLCQDSDTFYSP